MNGQELRRWRAVAGMRQVELAAALDVPQATISRWETGRHAIAQPRLLTLALRGLALERAEAAAWDQAPSIQDAAAARERFGRLPEAASERQKSASAR